MTRRLHAAHVVACGLLLGGTGASAACEAVLREFRSGVELARLPLEAAAPELRIAFEHSVLGTTVTDRYRFTPTARLVEERFAGEGYGLPHAAGPGERLERDGAGWRLTLDREVHPLVVRPLAPQRMRIVRPGHELVLATFGVRGIEITARGCPAGDPS